MFIGIFKNANNKIENYIYYNWEEWHKDTFNLTTQIICILELKIKGKNYTERKSNLIELAIDWQYNFSSYGWSYGEITEIYNFFEKNAKRYGLIQEFKQNCII